MKKAFLGFVLYFIANTAFGQYENGLSTEFDAHYYYYFTGENTNNFNYGFSLLVSKYVRKLKLSTGVNYALKSYDSEGDVFYSIDKRKYKAEYLNFPIIIGYNVFSSGNFFSTIQTGFIFNKIINYTIKSFYMNGEILTEKDLLSNEGFDIKYMIGMTFSKSIHKNMILNASPFLSYKVVLNSSDERPDYTNIPDDKLSAGFSLGFEYVFKPSAGD
jgi:hypothetical protein